METEQWSFYEGEQPDGENSPLEPAPEDPLTDVDLSFLDDPALGYRQACVMLHHLAVFYTRRGLKGDEKSAARANAMIERLSKMRGFEAPQQVAVAVTRRKDPTDPRSYSMDELMAIIVEDLGLPPGTVLTTDQIDLIVKADKAKQIIQGECIRHE